MYELPTEDDLLISIAQPLFAAFTSIAVIGLGTSQPELTSQYGHDNLRPGQVVTIAGNGERGYSGDGQDALDARLNVLLKISVGPDGSVYIADSWNKRLRVVSPDGTIDTVPGTRAERSPETDRPEVDGWIYSPSNVPLASAVGPDGSLYVAATEDIRRIEPDGTVTVIAGGGEQDPDVTGPAVDARIYEPTDIAVDAAGNVYLADELNSRIRKIDTAGIITTIAGGGDKPPAKGLAAVDIKARRPVNVAVDSKTNVYFTLESDPAVYKVDTVGVLTIITGTITDRRAEPSDELGDGGPAVEAKFSDHEGRSLAIDADDNLYLTDRGNRRIRMIDPDGIVSTVRPSMTDAVVSDRLDDLAVGPQGDLYFSSGSQVMMVVNGASTQADDQTESEGEPSWADEEPGTVVTVAGTESDPKEQLASLSPWALSPDAALGPHSVAVDSSGVIYYADTARHVVNMVNKDGTLTALAGTGEAGVAGDGGAAVDAQLDSPVGLAVDSDGNVYIADAGNGRIRKVNSEGVISTVAGSRKLGPDTADIPAGDGGSATKAVLAFPVDVAVAADGSLYVADRTMKRIRKIDKTGTITTLAGGGDLYAAKADNEPATKATLWDPSAVAVDQVGNVYFIEAGKPSVRMVRTDGVLVTVAGDSYRDENEGGFTGDGGPAVAAELNTPTDLAVGTDGSLYIADTYNSRVRKVGPSGVISTIAGTGEPRDGGDGEKAAKSSIDEPESIAVDTDGNVYFTGRRGDAIRRIDSEGTISTVVKAGDTDPDADRPDGIPALDADLGSRLAIAVDRDGRLYIADHEKGQLSVVDFDGVMSNLATPPNPLGLAAAFAITDGELYAVINGATVVRLYPDGDFVVRGPSPNPMFDGDWRVIDIAGGPDGVLYATTTDGQLLASEADGTVRPVPGLGDNGADDSGTADMAIVSVAAGPDGTIYVTDQTYGRVLTVDAEGEITTVAGGGDGGSSAEDIGDGGPATETTLEVPEDLVVDTDGNVYVSTYDGIRRVDTDGVITTIFETPTVTEGDSTRYFVPASLTLGPRGDLYFVDTSTQQVRVIVRPAEISDGGPGVGGFGWPLVGGVAGGVVVAAAAVALVLVQRRRRVTPEQNDSELSAAVPSSSSPE